MTILGCRVTDYDHAVMWTDSQVFLGGVPGPEEPKLAVNPFAGIALVAGGSVTLLRPAYESFHRAGEIDDCIDPLAAALRRRCATIARQMTRAREGWLANQVVVVVGFSSAYNRMLCYRFEGASLFEPVQCLWTHAPVASASEPGPRDMMELVALARRQHAVLREVYPTAAAGALQVAEVGRGSIACRTIPDFGCGSAGQPAPSPDGNGEMPIAVAGEEG